MNQTEKSFGKFMLLWSGDFISAIGSGLTSFGLGVYIFQQTGKVSLMALVTLLAFLPSLLLGPIAGVLAGFLLTISDIRLLLVLDICTFFVTVATTLVVKKGLQSQKAEIGFSFFAELKTGWDALHRKKGILTLVVMGALITFCLGFIQTLASPMVLSFSDSATLGTLMTVITLGMLVSSGILGGISIKKGYAGMLSLSLFGAGVFMALFGMRENVVFIGVAGFLFFAMLPFANASLDYLLRTNIDNSLQGRAWGLIGLISQLGYVAAYAVSGLLADYVFTPLLLDGGALSENVGKILGTGPGRGIGLLIVLAGGLLCVTSVILLGMKSIRRLENGDVENGGVYES